MSTVAPRLIALAQGASYVAFGAWAVVARRNYVERHELEGTSPWVLNAHAGWMTLVGAMLTSAAVGNRVDRRVQALGLASSGGLALNDAALLRRIPPVYRADLAWEAAVAVAWVASRRASPPRS